MRSIVHEILARYLESDQYAFEATSRELWPVEGYVPLTGGGRKSRQAAPEDPSRSYGELQPQECN